MKLFALNDRYHGQIYPTLSILLSADAISGAMVTLGIHVELSSSARIKIKSHVVQEGQDSGQKLTLRAGLDSLSHYRS